jgi:DNA/RNA-binding domain of Phe-tRNA-synthetase-like protein
LLFWRPSIEQEAMEIRVELPGVRLGLLEADGMRLTLPNPALAPLMSEVCEHRRRGLTLERLAEAEATRAVRAMFRAWGVDPSKYRPSSEALLRRVVQGKGLYRVLDVVDIANLGSIETGWPYGCYDRSRIRGPITFRAGHPGETYEGIGKRIWHLAGRPVLADTEGPFGSPISDSTRSMITESAHDVLTVIYAPASAPAVAIDSALARLGERFSQYAGALALRSAVC